MDEVLNKIVSFIDKHHVMSLASMGENGLSACNLFYAFDEKELSFVVASSDETQHIQNILKNPKIAGTIVLETKTVGKIQGLQFNGTFTLLQERTLKKLYFKTFPYVLAMNPKLWKIQVDHFKLTDNTLGFGKKLLYKPSKQ